MNPAASARRSIILAATSYQRAVWALCLGDEQAAQTWITTYKQHSTAADIFCAMAVRRSR